MNGNGNGNRRGLTRAELAALVLVALFAVGCAMAVWALQRDAAANLTRAQIASCERVNLLRRNFNERGLFLERFVRGEIAAYARYLASPPGPPLGDEHVEESAEKRATRELIDTLTALGRSAGRVEIVDCPAAVRGER